MKALFAGSFDPIHLGHVDIIERASKLFDELHIVIAQSSEKQALINLADRKELASKSLNHLTNIKVSTTSGLVTDYARENQIGTLIRGLRIIADFEFEQSMDWHNHILAPEIETVCLMTRPNLRFVSSRGLKELYRHGQNIQEWVPSHVAEYLQKNKL